MLMNRKELVALVFLVVITLGLSAGAIYQYQHKQNVTNVAITKANKQRDAAVDAANGAKFNLTASNTQLQAVTVQKQHLCAVLTAKKLSDPVCLLPKE